MEDQNKDNGDCDHCHVHRVHDDGAGTGRQDDIGVRVGIPHTIFHFRDKNLERGW